jgi:hypothetical protein
MSPTREDMQAEIFKAARRGQAVVIGVIRTSAGAVRSATPHVHVTSAKLAERLPKPGKLAGNARHLAGRLPNADQLVGNARRLTENLPRAGELAANRRHFGEKLLASQQKLAANARRASAVLFPAGRKDARNSPGSSDAAPGDAGTTSTGSAQAGAEDGNGGGAA